MRTMTAHAASTPASSYSTERIKDAVLTLAVFAAALSVRIYGLGFQPFWMDEITAIRRAGQPFLSLVSESLTFHHLPAYFWMLSELVPFGTTETIMRLPSAVFGALTCAVSAAISKTIGGRACGLAAGLLTACAPLQVSYAQEARPQALVVLFVTVALYAIIKLALDPKAASLPLRSAAASRGC